MRKRNHLIWPLGLALTLTVAGVAWANGTQSLTGGIKPTKLSKTTYKPVKLTLSAALSPQSPAPSDSHRRYAPAHRPIRWRRERIQIISRRYSLCLVCGFVRGRCASGGLRKIRALWSMIIEWGGRVIGKKIG